MSQPCGETIQAIESVYSRAVSVRTQSVLEFNHDSSTLGPIHNDMTLFRPIIYLSVTALLFMPAAFGSAIDRCTEAAIGYIDALGADQVAQATESFDSPERQKWAYLTGSKTRTHGVAFGDLSEAQKVLAHRLLACSLSAQGYLKAIGIIQLDDLVRARMDAMIFPQTSDFEIGRDFYWLGVFGTPGSGEPWGWQLEGHHLGLNFTVVGDSIAVTPAFLGADPAEIQTGPMAGQRLLGREEDLAFDLIRSLSDEQRSRAVLADAVPKGLFTSPGRGHALTEFAGLRAEQMSAQQRQLLWLLIGEYVQNAEPGTADRMIGQLLSTGSDSIYFAWMGPTEAGSAIYYRIHGPGILIEFDHGTNVQSPKLGSDTNHIHSIMRIPGGDFGDDLLRRHYEESADH